MARAETGSGFLIGEALIEKAVLFCRNLSAAFSSNLTRRATTQAIAQSQHINQTDAVISQMSGFVMLRKRRHGLSMRNHDTHAKGTVKAIAETVSIMEDCEVILSATARPMRCNTVRHRAPFAICAEQADRIAMEVCAGCATRWDLL